ncbi:serine/threonine protein kinase, CMGC, CDC2/CDK sub [Entomophthora muscae]|uniref:Serine/threonine protein kinase, CMGC, CDC2/CDK sub n=1 Tax=Entomophthora muscae TaxID=34485 RepID=A0ACC2RGQ0_9FUNG|nr:serine/threonine protein kinase, CMGC, CDC2/CDK sub [Entomophthora muscae]
MSSLRPSQFTKEQMTGHDPLAVSPWMQKENRAKYAYTPTIIPKYPSKPPPTSLIYRKFVGSSLKSDYAFERKLGEGTIWVSFFGLEVHQGVHIRSQTPVAIKRFIVHNNEEGMPITSVREVKILKACDHKNLLSLSDTISVRGKTPFVLF